MDYKLTRAKRRTIAIYVRDDASVEVRAPIRTPKHEIDRFVVQKTRWINEKTAAKRAQSSERSKFVLDYGSKIQYLGENYPIVAEQGELFGFDGARFFLPIGLDSAAIREKCVDIYKSLARRYLPELTRAVATQTQLFLPRVRITGAASRWGSCSARGSVNFSWRLVMADTDAIRYVVIHELAHSVEMNHSARFWNLVSSFCPDYKDCKSRLRALQQRIRLENWG